MTRSILLLIIGSLLAISSLYFLHAAIGFLAGEDYVSGLLVVLASLALVRAGVQLATLSLTSPGSRR